MKINVDAPVHQQDILAALEGNTELKYTYIGHPKGMVTQIQFEVEDGKVGDVVGYTKKYIRSKLGNALVFRVLEDGKFW